MSSERKLAIEIKNLSKCYQVYNKPQHRLLQGLFRRHKRFYREFWSIRDVSMDIEPGETVGIIGRNGSGKSTLLQVIAGTLTPTSGSCKVQGRVAALLELGSGFNPEFTGRENVFLNAAILGLSRNETNERFGRIREFADIGDFIEQPVKTYSSGMYMRLAFSVAINVDPDILIIDEALSVGDEIFQRKCFSRIQELKSSGVTILFVSHAANAIVELCDRAVLMDEGERLLTGLPKMVVAKYQKLLYADTARAEIIKEEIRRLDVQEEALLDNAEEQTLAVPLQSIKQEAEKTKISLEERFDEKLIPKSTVSYTVRGAEITNARILTRDHKRVNVLISGREYIYAYDIEILRDVRRVQFGMLIKSNTGVELSGMSSHTMRDGVECLEAGQILTVEFRFYNYFLPGTYFTNAGCTGVIDGEETFLHRILDAVAFRVISDNLVRAKAGYFDISHEPSCVLSMRGTLLEDVRSESRCHS